MKLKLLRSLNRTMAAECGVDVECAKEGCECDCHDAALVKRLVNTGLAKVCGETEVTAPAPPPAIQAVPEPLTVPEPIPEAEPEPAVVDDDDTPKPRRKRN